MHSLFLPHVELPSSADFLMSSRKFGLSILRIAENPLQQQHLYAIFPIMVLFLIMSPPIAGLLMLFTLFPEWYRDRLLFAAAGRAFLWFWAGAALSFIAERLPSAPLGILRSSSAYSRGRGLCGMEGCAAERAIRKGSPSCRIGLCRCYFAFRRRSRSSYLVWPLRRIRPVFSAPAYYSENGLDHLSDADVRSF
jgi:hypothetical protein